MGERIIFHIDLDAFFAAVEQRANPNLRNQPLIVVGRHRRSVVSCANYPAREHGIRAAMPVYRALEKLPTVKMVNVNMPAYERASAEFKEYLARNVSDRLEDFSIDECFLDVSHCVRGFAEAVELAKQVQGEIEARLGLSASIGISCNKFLAKMATDMKKPKGITLLLPGDVSRAVWPLGIERMLWVGSAAKRKLNDLGIKTIGDLANFSDLALLKPVFGKNAAGFVRNAWGYGDDFVDPSDPLSKSISISKTLFENTDDADDLVKEVVWVCKELYAKMWRQGMTGTTLTLGLKTDRWEYRTKSHTAREYVLSEADLVRRSLRLFNGLFADASIRLVAVGVSNLKPIDEVRLPVSLFGAAAERDVWLPPSDADENPLPPKNPMAELARRVNDEIGKQVVFVANDLPEANG